MAKIKTQSQVRKKKKMWLQINAPKLFGNKKIGETNVLFPENAIGKTVELNLMTLTGEMRKQNLNMKFIIDDVKGNVASTKIISYKMAPSFIKRLVRRRRDKIDYSKIFITKDNVKVRIKPLIIIASQTRGSTQTALEKKSAQLVLSEVKKLTFNEFVDQVVSFKFQITLKNELKKIHPLKSCDIRQFLVESKQDSNAFVEVEDESADGSTNLKNEDKKVKNTEKKESKEEITNKEEIKQKEENVSDYSKEKEREKTEDAVKEKKDLNKNDEDDNNDNHVVDDKK